MDENTKSNIGILIMACAIVIAIFTFSFILVSNIAITANGQEQQQHTYYLGDIILESSRHKYYFHGFESGISMLQSERLLIGHYFCGYAQGGMSNMKVILSRSEQFRLSQKTFKVMDFGRDFIVLSEVK